MFRTPLIVVAMALAMAGCQGDAVADADSKPPSATLLSERVPSPEARRSDRLYAYIESARTNLSDGKTQLINQVMRLSREESAKFWPIYHDYEEELFALGDQRVELSRRFVTAHSAGTFDDAEAAALSDDWFRIETQQLELLRKYDKRIAEELSPLRAVQFTQIEHRVRTLVDVIIASELPLVRTELPSAQR
jgi:hypothetical protein